MPDSEFDIFKIHNDIEPKHGRVLISGPFLQDVYFSRSVVLLTEHNDEGTVGFVLNKPMKIEIQEVLKDFPEFDAYVSLGGPVNTNTIHFIHTLGELIPNSLEILEGLFWGGDFDEVQKLIELGGIKSEDIIFFIGYSGWTKGQLKEEINQNSWIVSELSKNEIMNNKYSIWDYSLSKYGDKYKLWANFPENPSFN